MKKLVFVGGRVEFLDEFPTWYSLMVERAPMVWSDPEPQRDYRGLTVTMWVTDAQWEQFEQLEPVENSNSLLHPVRYLKNLVVLQVIDERTNETLEHNMEYIGHLGEQQLENNQLLLEVGASPSSVLADHEYIRHDV